MSFRGIFNLNYKFIVEFCAFTPFSFNFSLQVFSPRISKESSSASGFGSSDDNSNSTDALLNHAAMEVMDTSEEPVSFPAQHGSGKTGELPSTERMVAMMHLSESAPSLSTDLSLHRAQLAGGGDGARFPDDFNDVYARFDHLGEEHQICLVQELLLRMNQYQHGEVNSYLKPLLKRDFISLLSSESQILLTTKKFDYFVRRDNLRFMRWIFYGPLEDQFIGSSSNDRLID